MVTILQLLPEVRMPTASSLGPLFRDAAYTWQVHCHGPDRMDPWLLPLPELIGPAVGTGLSPSQSCSPSLAFVSCGRWTEEKMCLREGGCWGSHFEAAMVGANMLKQRSPIIEKRRLQVGQSSRTSDGNNGDWGLWLPPTLCGFRQILSRSSISFLWSSKLVE